MIIKAGSIDSAPPIPIIHSAPPIVGPPPIVNADKTANGDEMAGLESSDGPAPRKSAWISSLAMLFNRGANNASLVSFIVHVLLILVMAIWAFRKDQLGEGVSLKSGWSSGDDTGANFNLPSEAPTKEISESVEAPEVPTEAASLDVDVPQPSLDPSVKSQVTVTTISPAGVSLSAQLNDVSVLGGMGSESFRGTNLTGRELSGRSERARRGGGTIESEEAVELALRWFAEHQFPDGGWSLNHIHDECNGQCPNPTVFQLDSMRSAATGLALLSFLGAGYTHQEGEYREVVRKGLYFLMQSGRQTDNGIRFSGLLSENAMYEQGIATFALCEAYQMTKDQDLKNFCQDAINYIRYAQHSDGGWDYRPKGPGDLSIGCWQMMAFKSAVASGLKVPIYNIKAFDSFLNSQQSDGGALYGYRGITPRPSTTAIGLLMRMYRGMGQTDPALLRGIQYLIMNGPSDDDVYLNYYATQVLYHQQGRAWEDWNEKLRDYLVKTQSKQGHSAGSWFFPNTYSLVGGRHYCTAMNCMTLEVYYRVLPIYQEIERDDFQF